MSVALQPVPTTPTFYTCPVCGGALWETHNLAFYCGSGHAITPEDLLTAQHSGLARSTAIIVRAFEENIALGRQLAERAAAAGLHEVSQRYIEQTCRAGEQATRVQDAFMCMTSRADEQRG